MRGFTLETVTPPVQIPFANGGGVSILDKRNYIVRHNPGNPSVTYLFRQELGYLTPAGFFAEKRVEKTLALSAAAYALMDQAAFAAAPDNASRVAVIQKAYDAAPQKPPPRIPIP